MTEYYRYYSDDKQFIPKFNRTYPKVVQRRANITEGNRRLSNITDDNRIQPILSTGTLPRFCFVVPSFFSVSFCPIQFLLTVILILLMAVYENKKRGRDALSVMTAVSDNKIRPFSRSDFAGTDK